MKIRSDGSRTLRATRLMLIASTSLYGALAQTAFAADPNSMVAESGWEYRGEIEAGGRFFIDRPPSGFGRAPAPDNWLTPRTSESRAKLEEYGAIKPGLFLDYVNLGFATKDGRYDIDFWAQNAGQNNQFYSLDIAKIGEHYLTLEWDQIPHLISTSAKTVFGGVGTTNLTVNDALQTNLEANQASATAPGAAGIAARTAIEGFVNGAATSLTLGTQRDKASVAYRYTPDSSWDFKVDYSNERRTGTRPVAINWGSGFASNIVELPQPLDDRTQNVSATAQYVGVTPWDKKWIARFNYSGSIYDNDLSFLSVENPFCLTLVGGCRPDLRLALAPSNSAHAFTLNNVIDLPGKSRLANTFQYNMMRQNDPFVSTQINGLVLPDAWPATSANAKVNTMLANSVLTTQITKDVKSTLRYRYYDFDNNTPELLWGSFIRADSSVVTADRRNLALAYTKQNAGAELNWHALSWLRLGAIYGWEQYDRTRRDVNVTNEHSGKIYMDADLWGGALARANVMYAVRRYDKYDLVSLVADYGLLDSENLEAMRKFDIANRNRIKGEAFVDIPLGNAVITPNFGLRFDSFPTDAVNQLGVSKDNGWNAGIEFSAKLTPALRLMLAYNYEERRLHMDDCCGGAAGGLTPANIWSSDIKQRYNTVIAAADWLAIPERLDLRFEYLLALGSEANNTTPCASGADGCTGSGTGVTTTQFPTERNSFQRFSVLARYFVDPTVVRQMGWQGDVILKFRYAFLRNRNTNWATDNMTPYIPTEDQTADLTGGGRSIFLAALNPNYTAHIVAMSLAIRW
jgi:MtrB/PioB family decaheme-associated outer membrane protein